MAEATATAKPDLKPTEMIAKCKKIIDMLNEVTPADALSILSMVDGDQLTRSDLRPDLCMTQKINMHIGHIAENVMFIDACRQRGKWPQALEEVCGNG